MQCKEIQPVDLICPPGKLIKAIHTYGGVVSTSIKAEILYALQIMPRYLRYLLSVGTLDSTVLSCF